MKIEISFEIDLQSENRIIAPETSICSKIKMFYEP